MSAKKPTAKKPTAKKPTAKKKPAVKKPTVKKAASDGFISALSSLLKARKIKVPKGLATASEAAYAGQSAQTVELLARLSDEELTKYADRIAAYDLKRQERVRSAWEGSPLIRELRRRGLKEPKPPVKMVGVGLGVPKPLSEWTDQEITRAAKDWSDRAR